SLVVASSVCLLILSLSILRHLNNGAVIEDLRKQILFAEDQKKETVKQLEGKVEEKDKELQGVRTNSNSIIAELTLRIEDLKKQLGYKESERIKHLTLNIEALKQQLTTATKDLE